MRKVVWCLVLALSALGSVRPSLAALRKKDCVGSATEDASDCDHNEVTTIVVSSPPQGAVQPSVRYVSSDGKKYVPYNRLSTGPDGQPCATTGYVEEKATPPDERLLVDPNPRETNIPVTGSDLRILEDYPLCPEQPLAPGESPPVETRAMVVARYLQHIPLPHPNPSIAPG